MTFELLTLGGYGPYIWPAFIFTFASFFILYLKIKRELNKQELAFYKEINTIKIKIISKEKEVTKSFYPSA